MSILHLNIFQGGFSGLKEDIRHQLLDEQKMTS